MLWDKNERPDEYDLMKLRFKQVFAFRQGAMKYVDCQTNLSRMNKVFIRLYPASKTLFLNCKNPISQPEIHCLMDLFANEKGPHT